MKQLELDNEEQLEGYQRGADMERPLSHVLILLIGARTFFLVIGLIFFLGTLTEWLILNTEVNFGTFVEIGVISIFSPIVVWISTKWAERVVKQARYSNQQIINANSIARREIAERRNTESALLESEKTSQRLAEENAFLADIGRIVSSTLEIEEVYEAFAHRVQDFVSFDVISVSIIDFENKLLSMAYVSGSTVQGREPGIKLPLEGTLAEQVANTRCGTILDMDNPEKLKKDFPGLAPSFAAGYKSILGVPLISNDLVIGALQFRTFSPDSYDSRHLSLAESVGSQISGAVANSELHGTLQREAREREVLARIGRVIGSSIDIGEVYKPFATEVGTLVNFDIISLNLTDKENDSMLAAYHDGISVSGRHEGDTIPLSGTLAGEVIKQRSTLLFQGRDLIDAESRLPGLSPIIKKGLQSFISTPLTYKDDIIGVFSVGSLMESPYSERDKDFIERVGSQIAGAIANSRLYEERKQAEEKAKATAREKAALAEIGKTVSLSLDLDSVYDRLAKLVQTLVPHSRFTISEIAPEGDATIIAYHTGDYVKGREQGDRVSLKGALAGKVVDQEATVVVSALNPEDLQTEYPGLVSTFEAGFRSFLGVPLISNNKLYGILQFRSKVENAYTEDIVNAAESVASQIAGAIVNAHLHATVQREAEEREVLANIGRIISSTLDIQEIYANFAEEVKKLIEFDRINIPTINRQDQTFSYVYTMGVDIPERRVGDSTGMGGTLTSKVQESGVGVIVQSSDYEQICNEFSGLSHAWEAGLRSFMAVPLIARDEVIGSLHLSSLKPDFYSEADLKLAERIGAQIAGAIANSHLHAERMAAELALRQSEWRYKEMVESASDLVYTTDENGWLTYVNPPTLKLTEYREDELIGTEFSQLAPEDWKRHVQRYYRNRPENYTQEAAIEFPILTKKGQLKWLEQTVAPVVNDGKITGFQGIGRDITRRKQIQDEREKLITELQNAAAEIKTLGGLLPICAACKMIRDDKGYWNQIETYISDHSEADFSHSICPDCYTKLYPTLKSPYEESKSP